MLFLITYLLQEYASPLFCYHHTVLIAGKCAGFDDGVVKNLEVKLVPTKTTDTKLWLFSYETYDCGGELMCLAWSKMKHVFSTRRRNEIRGPDQGIVETKSGPEDGVTATPLVLYLGPDISHNVLLWKHPMGLFQVPI